MTNKYEMTNIGLALEYLLKNLQDDDNRKVFDNVILGLSEKDVKQFNNCIGIAYVKGANEFKNSFGTRNVPEKVNTVVAFVVKGTQRARYDEAMKIADIILYNFRHNNDWIYLKGENGKPNVNGTDISDFNVSIFENNKKLDTACVFALSHTLCN